MKELSEEQKKENMYLWKLTCETDPKDTKPFKGKGGFKGIAIAAQSQRKRASELWGSFGGNWGIRNERFSIIKLSEDPHDTIMAYTGEFYYPGGVFGIHSDIDIWTYVKAYKSWVKNNDIHKKVRTDAFTKGLSELGFNADVFMGLYEDSKYVESMKETFEEKITEKQIKEIDKLKKDLDMNEIKYVNELNKSYNKAATDRLNTEQADMLIIRLKAKLEQQKKDAEECS